MRLENKKVSIAMLSVLLSAGSAYPAFAGRTVEVGGEHRTSNVQTSHRTIEGTIKSIVGEVVTIDVENRDIQTFRMSQQTLKIMGLVPGMRIAAVVSGDQLIAENVRILPKVAAVRTETTRVQVTTKKEETRSTQQQRVVTPTPRPTPRVEIRQQETRQTQERRVVTPLPAPVPASVPSVEPIKPVRGLW